MGRVSKYNDEKLPPEIRRFIAMKAQKSNATANHYRQALHRLLVFLEETGSSLGTMTEDDLEEYVASMRENGVTATGISSNLRVLQPFFNHYMLLRGVDKDEFCRMVAYCKGMRVKPTGEHTYPALTAAQQAELYLMLKNPYLRTMVWASISYGFRAQEICNLHMCDVQINESGVNESGEPDWGRVVIRESKGNKTRSVYILKEHVPIWRFYFRLREKDQVEFPNVFYWNLRPLSVSTYSNFFKAHIGDQVSFQMTSHSLRRTFGTNLLRHGVNLVVIQNLMGHESLDVTRKYLNVLERETQQMYLKDMGSATS